MQIILFLQFYFKKVSLLILLITFFFYYFYKSFYFPFFKWEKSMNFCKLALIIFNFILLIGNFILIIDEKVSDLGKFK